MVLDLNQEKLEREKLVDEGDNTVTGVKRGRPLSLSRLRFLKFGIVGGFTVLGLKLWDLQVNQGPKSQPDSSKSYIQYIQTNAPRGIIFDGKGNVIASNDVVFNVTITPAKLPQVTDPSDSTKGQQETDARQAVYDNLARFLGMNYWVGVIPEQVNGKNQPKVAAVRNATINAISEKLKISALDIDKMLNDAVTNGVDNEFLTINTKPIPIDDKNYDPTDPKYFEHFMELRNLYGVYFISDGQKAVLLSEAIKPEYEPVVVWENISREDALKLEELLLDLPGVAVQQGYKRNYKDPNLFCHIIGYTGVFTSTEEYRQANEDALKNYTTGDESSSNITQFTIYSPDDRIGRTGIEAQMEAYLRGIKGGREVEVDASNHIISTIDGSERSPVPGSNVYLTIDPDIQKATTDALQQALDDANKNKGQYKGIQTASAVVLDVRTGEVKALVALPVFDNNIFNGKISDEVYNTLFNPDYPLTINYAVNGQFAPGSTFKLITASAGLQDGIISIDGTFNCHGTIDVPLTQNPTPAQRWKCWWPAGHGAMNVVGGIENSCDIYFYNVGAAGGIVKATNQPLRYYEPNNPNPIPFKGLGIKRLNQYMEMYGVGSLTGIELPEEMPGLMPTVDWDTKRGGVWSLGDDITTSIGQGYTLMTPLQVANMTAAVATGKLLKPTIVKSVTQIDSKGNEVPVAGMDFTLPKVIHEIAVDKKYLDAIRQGMGMVTSEHGTAYQLNTDMGRLKVAGKTGTAEYGSPYATDPKTGDDLYPTHAWFTSFAPFDNPEYAITVVLQAQAGTVQIEGTTYSVPVAKKVYQTIYAKDSRFFDQPKPTPVPSQKNTPSPGAAGKKTTTTPSPKH